MTIPARFLRTSSATTRFAPAAARPGKLFGGGSVRRFRRWSAGAAVAAVVTALIVSLSPGRARAEMELPAGDPGYPIVVRAEAGNRWRQGEYEVWLLRGNCQITQGPSQVACRDAVLWVARRSSLDHGRTKVIAYLEGDVKADIGHGTARGTLTDETWLGRFLTDADVRIEVTYALGQPATKPPIYARAVARRSETLDRAVQPAQRLEPIVGEPAEAVAPPTRRIRVFSRSDVPIQAQWFPNPQTNQGIAVINSGVNVVVDGLQQFGAIDISADRVVIWTVASQEPGLTGEAVQDESTPLEIYMEGNVVFRQGQRLVQADRMYYNVNLHKGIVLGTEILTPAPKYAGLVRLKADIVQQVGEGQYFAQNAWFTSSRMGEPRYRLQAGNVYFEDIQQPAVDPFSGAPLVDPATGEPAVDHQQMATSKNNFLFLGDVPIFYWPMMATDVSDPTLYIRRARFKSDKAFGTQILTDWNMYQLLGIRQRPEGTDWDLSLDYLSKRGFGHGTTFAYNRPDFLGFSGPASGLVDFWGIKDHGDDLLSGRGWVPPETDYRYRLFWQHRQILAGDYQLSAEVGLISDRNFLEEYYRNEWETLKDETTGIELKHSNENVSWSIAGDYRVNDFVTGPNWLPRLDHYWIGQNLFGDILTWHEHTSVAYAGFRTTTAPAAANDAALFAYLPWEVSPGGTPLSLDGERFATRHEIDMPLQAGPVKVVPYALGELAHWGADRTGNDLQRAYWQAGVRASIPFWKVNPAVENDLWNLHGLAHKVVFDAEFAFARSNRDMTDLPLYDPLDDNSIEAFRRRFAVNTFLTPAGGVFANPPFDERYYALRSGLAGWVTSPSTEVADDLTTLRLGMRHRWQTTRGRPDNRRIIDWITFDTNAVLFPDPNRDNFGETLGLVDYDFRWYIGDRLTLLSSGLFDFFPDGPQEITIGGYLQRPPRTSLYLGLRMLEGPISSQVLIASVGYRMSPKWVGAVGASVDLSGENIGQTISITRVGESLLLSVGVTVDAIRGDTGVLLALEPRFLPNSRLGGSVGRIPAAGLFGLE